MNDPILLQAKDNSLYKPRRQSTTAETGQISDPDQDEAKGVFTMLGDEAKHDEYTIKAAQHDRKATPDVHNNHCEEFDPHFDLISEDSNSYVMVEYGLNPYERRKLTRRKSCLCRHQDIIFHDTEDSEFTDTLPEDILGQLDHYYLDKKVTKSHSFPKVKRNRFNLGYRFFINQFVT